MELSEYEIMSGLERDHWWFWGKRRILFRMLRALPMRPGRPSVLDLGCGTGGLLRELTAFGNAVGVDYQMEALTFARTKSDAGLFRATALALPFPDKAFDLVFCCDMLYHRNVEDVTRALREAARVLKDDGWLLITDSALEMLRSEHDRVMHAARRFSAASMRSCAEGAGLRVHKISYMNFFIFPAVLFVRKGLNPLLKRSGSDVRRPSAAANAFLKGVMLLESVLLPRISFPFGTSVICVAGKKT